ncbi:MAG TPA: cob(I)yrinic acid a,c-diamide adenosyltransferase [Terriglobia bacterium]|nr:cob(I)yrinic acid a,c-diamide adenosyltransferase [Terriglobia bacterium]
MKIYTKTGDRGDTRLFDGTRTRKDDPRVNAYGDVDELNAFIGASMAWLNDPVLVAMLADVQRDLFSVGAELANPKSAEEKNERFHLDPKRITVLENAIDGFETELPPLRQFILAGGGPAGALLHVARTVCRRAERRVVELAARIAVDETVIKYLNRLSDFLFVLARLVNHRQGQQENPW